MSDRHEEPNSTSRVDRRSRDFERHGLDEELRFPLIDADFPLFGSKSAHISRFLPGVSPTTK